MAHLFGKKSIRLAGILIILLNRPQISALLSKCCPIGSQIHINNGNLPNCVKQENATNWELYNVDVSTKETQFPQCNYGVKQIFQASTNLSLLNGCLDKSIDGNLYTIRCKDQPAVDVHKLNKCCPANQSFDQKRQLCASSLASNMRFRQLFGDTVVILEPKMPHCDEDEVFVEFHSTHHDIAFVDRNLRIKSQHFPAGQTLRINQYCIESLLTDEDIVESKWDIIVWSCQPKDVVEKFPHILQCKNDAGENGDMVELDKPLCRNGAKIGKYDLCSVGSILSCVFLALTLIVYLSLPKVCCALDKSKMILFLVSLICKFFFQLLHLHGKTLVCYVFSLLGAFSTLAFIHINSDRQLNYCFEIGNFPLNFMNR